jgi:hypothetical protein
MASSTVNSHQNDETEFDFKECYSREKTLVSINFYFKINIW